MTSRLCILLAILMGGCTTLDSDLPASELTYGCDDLVVIGRVVTAGTVAISQPEASLPDWQSEWRLEVHVKRVIRGTERRRMFLARGISHAQITDDRDFLIVLRPREGGYELTTAAPWQKPRPILTEPCF